MRAGTRVRMINSAGSGPWSCRAGIALAGLLALAPVAAAGDAWSPDACTAFALFCDDQALVGKNLDWPIDAGILCLNPRGLRKWAWTDTDGCAEGGPNARPLEWVATYASLSFNQFGREFPLGGLNEAGLAVEETSYWPSAYPPAAGRPQINELQWIQYQLDRRGTVADVIEHAGECAVRPMIARVHYFLADAEGDAAVIEFLDGEMRIHHGVALPVPVLTNDTYANSVRYLARHAGFGGERHVGDGHDSPERFVRVAGLLQGYGRAAQADQPDNAVEHAFAILSAVAQADTQWSIVYDLRARAVRFVTAGVAHERWIALRDLPCDCGLPRLALPLHDPHPGDVAARLAPWGAADQERLATVVLAQLAPEADLADSARARLTRALVKHGSILPVCEKRR